MRYRLLPDTPRIHVVPLPEISIGKAQVTLRLDDVDGERVSLVFSPYQAVRVTTEDCFDFDPNTGLFREGVFVVEESPWIAELQSVLFEKDRGATFLTRSHHYVVPSGDDVVE